MNVLSAGRYLLGLALCAILIALPAGAAGLDLSSLSGYEFVDLGNTALGWNAYQLNGNVLFGQGLNVSMSGGNNGGLGAGYTAYADSTGTISGALQNPVTFVNVSTALTLAAKNTAQSVSTYASTLTPTQSFGSISGTTTITGNGGVNVINVASVNNAKLTISGSANDYFVFNVSGSVNENQAMTLTGGIDASHILWNLTGTSGHVLQTSGGDSLVGTFLATDGGQFQFSELALNGELINTDGNVQLVSGQEKLTQTSFQPPPSATPEPSTYMTLGAGLLVLGLFKLKRSL